MSLQKITPEQDLKLSAQLAGSLGEKMVRQLWVHTVTNSQDLAQHVMTLPKESLIVEQGGFAVLVPVTLDDQACLFRAIVIQSARSRGRAFSQSGLWLVFVTLRGTARMASAAWTILFSPRTVMSLAD